MSDDDTKGPHTYEIRIAGAIGEELGHAFSELKSAEVSPCDLLRIEVTSDNCDAAEIALALHDRGHPVMSVRRCDPVRNQDGTGA
jgi:hypothetical protein